MDRTPFVVDRSFRDAVWRRRLAIDVIASLPDSICAGFFLQHPTTRTTLPRQGPAGNLLTELQRQRRFLRPALFADLDAVAQFGRTLPAPPPVFHALALPGEDVDRLLDAEGDDRLDGTPAIVRLVQRRLPAAPLLPVRAGWNVLGLFGEQCLSWHQDKTARQLAPRLGLNLQEELMADRESALRLAEALNDDDLGAPVFWQTWWHTLLAAPA